MHEHIFAFSIDFILAQEFHYSFHLKAEQVKYVFCISNSDNDGTTVRLLVLQYMYTVCVIFFTVMYIYVGVEFLVLISI